MAVEAQTGSAGSALALLSRGRETVMAMPPKRRTMLGACLLMLLAVCAGVAWWEGRTDWKVLYAGLEGRDLQQVEQELAAAGIGYETTPDGAGVQVPAELLDKARMEVAAKGMPQTGRMGFELFDKPNWVGSEFDEKVNYQRAMEGELEHTIATLGPVRSARVHLVLPKDSLFSEQKQPAKASVVLKLKRAAMPAEAIESIRNLVAGAVENLSPEQVTLVDADGRLNMNASGRGGQGGGAQGGDAERELEQKLVAMIEPLAGQANVRATVNITYDETSQERTDEVVDPSQVVTLSMQKRDEQSGARAAVSGVPGTASNTAAAVAAGSVAADAAAAAKAALPVYPTSGGGQPQTMHEETGAYAVTRHTVHEERQPGRVKRVTAAVVVNDREVTEGDGKARKTSWRPRTIEEMKRMEQLAQAAIGFDDKRGDQVVMQNISFNSNVPEPKVENLQRAMEQAQTFLHTQPGLLRTVAGMAVAMLLIFVVVRPVTKQVIAVLGEQRELAGGVGALAGLPAASGARDEAGLPMAEVPGDASGQGRRPSRSLAAIDDEGVLQYVSEHFRREPAQSRRLLERWIGSKEGAA